MAIDAGYRPRNPQNNPLYELVGSHLETFLARQRERDRCVPGFVENEFFTPGRPYALFQTRIVGSGLNPTSNDYDVSRDGRFLINTALDDDVSPITLLQNWKPPTK